jgi:hypothetical protein
MSGVVYRSAQPVPAGQNNHGEALGLIRSSGAGTPDLQVGFVDVPLRAERLPGPAIGEGYTLATSLMLPSSRGTVRLASAEPGTPPLIDPNYYADPRDLEILAAGLLPPATSDALPPWTSVGAKKSCQAPTSTTTAACAHTCDETSGRTPTMGERAGSALTRKRSSMPIFACTASAGCG